MDTPTGLLGGLGEVGEIGEIGGKGPGRLVRASKNARALPQRFGGIQSKVLLFSTNRQSISVAG